MIDPLPAPEAQPVPETAPEPIAPQENRIAGLDVARGFALLGIFLVNIDFFALPFGEVATHDRPVPESTLAALLFWFVRIFCEGRFYPLFSLLFGIGLILQRESVLSRGGAFVPLYLRRNFLLMLIGLGHGLLFWYGDILFAYSVVALVLLLCSSLDRRVLLGLALASVLLSLLVLPLFQVLATLGPSFSDGEAALALQENAEPVAWSEVRELALDVFAGELEPMTAEYNGVERRAYREGSFVASASFRAASFLMVTFSFFFGGALPIATMFFLGAALVKYGLVGNGPDAVRFAGRWPWFAMAGIPLAVATGLLYYGVGSAWAAALGQVCDIFAGPLMALFFLTFWSWLAFRAARFGAVHSLIRSLSATGKLALTNYLLQTLIATFVMYHWGLAQFGSWGTEQRFLFVVVVWLLQVLASVVWLRYFRFGPLEWLWRSATYLQLQPLRRSKS